MHHLTFPLLHAEPADWGVTASFCTSLHSHHTHTHTRLSHSPSPPLHSDLWTLPISSLSVHFWTRLPFTFLLQLSFKAPHHLESTHRDILITKTGKHALPQKYFSVKIMIYFKYEYCDSMGHANVAFKCEEIRTCEKQNKQHTVYPAIFICVSLFITSTVAILPFKETQKTKCNGTLFH